MLSSHNLTYIGITNNIENRLLRHNSSKGAKATRRYNDWKLIILAGYFEDKSSAQSFEWFAKHQMTKTGSWTKSKSGINNKINRFHEVMSMQQFNHLIIIV